MTRPAFQRDNILNSDERAASARKCLNLLGDVSPHDMREKDRTFFTDQLARSKSLAYGLSEPQLQWLRDMVERYAQ